MPLCNDQGVGGKLGALLHDLKDVSSLEDLDSNHGWRVHLQSSWCIYKKGPQALDSWKAWHSLILTQNLGVLHLPGTEICLLSLLQGYSKISASYRHGCLLGWQGGRSDLRDVTVGHCASTRHSCRCKRSWLGLPSLTKSNQVVVDKPTYKFPRVARWMNTGAVKVSSEHRLGPPLEGSREVQIHSVTCCHLAVVQMSAAQKWYLCTDLPCWCCHPSPKLTSVCQASDPACSPDLFD